MAQRKSTGLRVAVTGILGDLGRLLLPRLVADPRVADVIALDVAAPPPDAQVRYRRVDLVRQDAGAELVDVFAEERIDVLLHLAFLLGPRRTGELAHEVEVIGTMRALEAAARTPVTKVVIASTSAVYGARREGPALLTEEAPLEGGGSSGFVRDKVEVERHAAKFLRLRPETTCMVLRFAPVAGPRCDNPVTRYLRRPLVPTLLGLDPMFQLLHEDDAASALLSTLDCDTSGAFNVAARRPLPLSTVVRASGAVPLPIPAGVVGMGLKATLELGLPKVSRTLLDYIRYSCLIDCSKAREVLGFQPARTVAEAAQSLRNR